MSYFVDPLINPFFSTFNFFLGSLFTMPIILALWYTNTYQTGYLPISKCLLSPTSVLAGSDGTVLE